MFCFDIYIYKKFNLLLFLIFMVEHQGPIVTVICLCYNHAAYVEQALQSVINQSYPFVQLIVADDASSDGSEKIISSFLNGRSDINFVQNQTNLGNCATFNIAFALAKGKYIIDLAADDVLLYDRISNQVTEFEKLDERYGVIFSDVFNIDERGGIIGLYENKKKIRGEIYKELLSSFLISAPSMMVRKSVLDHLGGYDENLAYEDFDFWVRSSRHYYYYYLPGATTLKRRLKSSLSWSFNLQRQYKIQYSTYLVCEKAFELNRNDDENLALAQRINYQIKQAYWSGNPEVVRDYINLLNKIKPPGVFIKLISILVKLGIGPSEVFKMVFEWKASVRELLCKIFYKIKFKNGIKNRQQSA